MIKVCIVDDHTIMREGLKKMLNEASGISVVESLACFKDVQAKLSKSDWDVLVLDMSLPDSTGLDVLKAVKKLKPLLPVLILTMHNEDQYGIRAFKAGASGYLTKDTASELLISTIRKLAKGEKYVSPSLAEKMVNFIESNKNIGSYEILSNREFEVLLQLGSGKSLSDIADIFDLSSKTISTYRTRVLEKLGISNNLEIIHFCIENQLLNK